MDRRQFLFGAGTLSVMLAARSASADQPARRVLVLVELKGGNDGMNTVVPYADPLYRQFRPGIAVPRERVMQLDEHAGLHDRLEPLMDSWKARELAIVQGVGYPYPNRSHFRSIEIWDTASASNQTLSEGWVSRAFDGIALPAGAGVDAIVADTNALPLTGPGLRTIVMQDAENFLRQAEAMKGMKDPRDGSNPALRHLLEVRHEVNGAAAGLREKLRNGPAPAFTFAPDAGFGHQLDLATRLLLARVPVVAIKVALTGFDTHANQVPTQERLLGVLASGLAVFRKNLIAAGQWNDVVVMTYSEFGRRAHQNASGGTDHGTSAPQFVMGGTVKGGLHGRYPSLADLQDGDLKYTVDFRNVYSALARACWGRPADFGQRPVRPLDLLA
ncbi:MAG: DUF1501 domain-containing protein [Proteobacteria bacterium]|nr:DUF1501 domain-containing protein [Pseudomonadota bacterium]